MITRDKVVVQDIQRQYTDVLDCFDWDSFQVTRQRNSQYQLDFVAFDDNSVGFELLQIENSVWWNNQEFIVKQLTDDWNGDTHEVTVTATHVFYQLNGRRQRQQKAGAVTFSLNDAVAFLLDGLNTGFDYQIHGTFANTVITDFGKCSVIDGISTLISDFDVYAVWPDGRTIHFYDENSWKHDTQMAIRYQNNSNEVSLAVDSSNLVNTVMVSGKQNDNGDAGSTPAFPPFMVQDDDSVKRWGQRDGDDISDERFTDPNAMRTYALGKMQSEPPTTITATMNNKDSPQLGEMWMLQVLPAHYQTMIETVAVQEYPFSPKATVITLNNLVANFLETQNASHRRLNQMTGKMLALESEQTDLAAVPRISIEMDGESNY